MTKDGEDMAQDKNKQVSQITDMDADFAQWYTDVCRKAELIDYSSIKGMFIYRPYGYAIWENIQGILDREFKQTGHENVYLPMLIPESLLQKEKDHVEGFAPECAWVTYGGVDKLEERYCIRPTSETLFCEHYANIIHSHRDLPKLYNQWTSVLRWEKTSRPFLRHREFLWQEGHTMHATAQEATYTVECMMHDRKALQGGTSHYFGDGFAKAFDITFTGKDNQLHHPFQTSWGVSTRMIAGIIMVHGDNNGLVLPPKVAPVQVIVIPVAQHKEGVIAANEAVMERLQKAGFRVKMDASDNSPGWKFAEYEMKGVPLRLELGPKDMEKGQCVLVRRDSGEKSFVPLDGIEDTVANMLEDIHEGLYAKAKKNLEENTYPCATLEEVKEKMASRGGFAKTMWCGDLECELKMKEEAGVSSRCIPFQQEKLGDVCACCGKPATKMVYWGVAY